MVTQRSDRPLRALLQLVLWIAPPMAAGALGAIPTTANLAWYRTLEAPFFAPPEWVFGPVWTLLNVAMGTAAFLVFRTGPETPGRRRALALFLSHLLFYVAWSVLFFGLRSPVAALVDIVLLMLSVALLTILFYRIRKGAGMLLVPYLAWVCFAAALNAGYAALNPLSP